MSLLQQFNQAQVDADADKKIKAVDGKATLYKRSSTQYWQVRFKLVINKRYCQLIQQTLSKQKLMLCISIKQFKLKLRLDYC